jgi:branched-chain amino acid transport system ATP-binding protein
MPRMVSQIREIVHALHRDGVAILLVEQNVPLTLEAADRVYIMSCKRSTASSPAWSWRWWPRGSR